MKGLLHDIVTNMASDAPVFLFISTTKGRWDLSKLVKHSNSVNPREAWYQISFTFRTAWNFWLLTSLLKFFSNIKLSWKEKILIYWSCEEFQLTLWVKKAGWVQIEKRFASSCDKEDLSSTKQNALFLKWFPLDSMGNDWSMPLCGGNYRLGNQWTKI